MKAFIGKLSAISIALILASVPVPASAEETQPFSRAEIERIIRDYILSNPEVLLESLETLEEKRLAAKEEEDRRGIRRNAKEIFLDRSAPFDGNAAGDITVVEFVDHRCPACKRFHPIVKKLVASDGKIKRIFKLWPILGPQSVVAARATLAARNQGKATAFHNALMETKMRLNEEAVMRIASAVGLDVERLERDMRSPNVEEDIRRNYRLADKLKLTGTPSFIVGDTLLRGGVDLDTLRELVESVRREG